MRALLTLLLMPATTLAAATPVCVDVQVKSWTLENKENPETVEPQFENPYTIDPAQFLGRHVRYEVTHEVGFEAVDAGCSERITIELYPLPTGWTVFARYSGHSREEKVDEVELEEFVSLAQRLSWALLRDIPVSDTITRENVLAADSESNLRTIHGTSHFVLGLGSQFKVGELPTADNGPAKEKQRFLTPISMQLGYRGKYEAWGLDFFFRGALGSNQQSPRQNPQGGHADFDVNGGMGLHLLRYTDAHGMTSFYYGGGAQFEISRYSIIQAEADREDQDREKLYSGGLGLDLLMGYEFLRASTAHIYLQAELQAPMYLMNSSVDAGGIKTYLPGGLFQIGIVF